MTLYEKLKKANKDKFVLKSVDFTTLQELTQLEMDCKIEVKMQGPHVEITMLKPIEKEKQKNVYVKDIHKFSKFQRVVNNIEGFKTYLSEERVYETLKYIKRGFTYSEISNACDLSIGTIKRIKTHFYKLAKGEIKE